jgi:hypothetical protein
MLSRASNNFELQLATSEITAVFELHSPAPIGSLTPMSQAIHEYINRANGMQSHVTTLMMETEFVSEKSGFINLMTQLSA